MNDYEVGYGKPPKHTQFKPGHSGNPKGRSKGRKNLWILIQEELNKKVKVKEGKEIISLTKVEVMVKKIMQDAMNGKSSAVKLVLECLYQLEATSQKTNEITWDEEKDQLLQELKEQVLWDEG